jgi:hypothetical protein
MNTPIYCPYFPTNINCENCRHNIGNLECALTYLQPFEIEDMLGVKLPYIKK